MREKILDVLEKNGRIDLKEMAIMLGYSEAEVANSAGCRRGCRGQYNSGYGEGTYYLRI